MTFPDFNNPALFPPFSTLPLASDTALTTDDSVYYLIGTLKHDMTASQYPTFICIDREGAQFALTLKVPDEIVKDNVLGGDYDVSRFKMGHSVVVKAARKKGVDGGKQGYVGVDPNEVKVIQCSVEKLQQLSAMEKEMETELGDKKDRWCQGCREIKSSAEQGGKVLVRCKGCESVRYCGKECQVKGWNKGGHKSDCKVFKAIGLAFE